MRRLSQHLTVDRRVLERLVELADPSEDDVVLEPGCGDGRLTEILAGRGCSVVAVEVDRVLAAEAERRLAAKKNVRVVEADVLSLDAEQFSMIVGNPPYHISRRLLEWLLSNPRPRRVVLTLQDEFAGKLVAAPGCWDYVYISVLAQLLYSVEVLDWVPSTSFKPRPRVASRIVRMERNGQAPLTSMQLRMLKAMFTDKRHVVGKVLRRLGAEPPKILAGKRVYQLSPKEFLAVLEGLADDARIYRGSQEYF